MGVVVLHLNGAHEEVGFGQHDEVEGDCDDG